MISGIVMFDKLKKSIKRRKKLHAFLLKIYVTLYDFIIESNSITYFSSKIKMFFGKHYQFNSYQILSVKGFCSQNNLKYRILEKEQIRDICIPHYYGNQEEMEIKKAKSPEIYIAELRDVEIIGANSFIIANDYCLYDMATMDEDERYDLRCESLKIIDKNRAFVGFIDTNEIIEKAIFLIGFASSNYYHVTVELLSRLQYIDYYEEYRSIPLLIDEIVLKIPQYRDLIQRINIHNHPIIPIERGQRKQVKKIIYPSYNTWMPFNLKKGVDSIFEDCLMASSGIESVRNIILAEISPEGNRKIFISRRNTNNARLINEEEVAGLFRRYDFEIIYPEELSFREQVELFSQAKYIAGPTGAAFTNILYCPNNATIICIIPKKYNFFLYSTISEALHLKSVYLDAQVTKKARKISGDQFVLDLNYCNDFLKTL